MCYWVKQKNKSVAGWCFFFSELLWGSGKTKCKQMWKQQMEVFEDGKWFWLLLFEAIYSYLLEKASE